MSTEQDNLIPAIDRLERALAARTTGREHDVSSDINQALAGVAEAARRHAVVLLPDDGKLVDVDCARLPSPVVTRRADALKDELRQFQAEAQALRNRPKVAGVVADFAAFLGRAKQLAAALRRYEQDEAELILESVNTDVGAGD